MSDIIEKLVQRKTLNQNFFEFRVFRGFIEALNFVGTSGVCHNFVHVFVQIEIFSMKLSFQNCLYAKSETILCFQQT